MNGELDFKAARDMLLAAVSPAGTENVPLSLCAGRVLAHDLRAAENVPAFDRSPYDGYAIRAEDSLGASRESPVTLPVLCEIAAGSSSCSPLSPGKAAKILTGAPIPPGADAVVKFEDTLFTDCSVTLFSPSRSGENIVRAGEDARAGQMLAHAGSVVDPGIAGCLAAQGVFEPLVRKKPLVGLIATGNELAEAGEALSPGKIRNSSRFALEAALTSLGCKPVFIGIARDSSDEISALVSSAVQRCDAVIITGGVSVGDYDLTPAALEKAGVKALFRNVALKPGGVCAYGMRGSVLVCALSGNPASAMTNFYAVALPALKRLCGRRDCLPEGFTAELAAGFKKKSPSTRLLRGRLDLGGGAVRFILTGGQGNAVLTSLIGATAMAEVPAGSGPLEAGTVLKGFLL